MDKNKDLYSFMTKEQRVLCGLLADNLFNVPFEPEEGIQWEKVIRESKSQAVTAVAFQRQQLYPEMDKGLRDELSKFITAAFMRNVKIRQNHGYLHKILSDAGIKYCILKGTASAHYYPQPLLRSMGDVDFYVSPEDVEATKKLFLDRGFDIDKFNSGDHGHHMVFRNQGKHLELHFEIAGVPKGKTGDLIREYLTDIIDSSEETTEEYVTYNNPCVFHHGLVMLLHMQHHMIAEGIGLRHLCDWAVFVNKLTESEFTRLYKDKLKRAGLWDFARIISLAACIVLKMPQKEWMQEKNSDIEIAKGIAEDILSGGNFGRKNKSRHYEGMLVSVAGRDGKRKTPFLRIIESLNKGVGIHWPIARKIPILYPVGWIFLVLRFFVKMILGKRPKLNVYNSFKESDRRSELYASLNLFEPVDDSKA